MRRFQFPVAALIASLAVSAANADDFIRVTFDEYCSIPCSRETSQIYVSRTHGPGWTVAEIDQLFASIRQILGAVNMPASWHSVPGIHSNRVKVEIQMEKTHYSLSADYHSTGIPVVDDEPQDARQRKIALEDILELTADYAANRYQKN